MAVFLMLSTLSGVLEVGVVLMVWAAGGKLWEPLAFAAMYQLGNLLFLPEKCSRKKLLAAETAAVILAVAGLWRESAVVSAVQVFLSSLCIQAVRAERKTACPAWLKRTFRIGGFALAPLLAVCGQAALLVCAVLPFLATLAERGGRETERKVQESKEGIQELKKKKQESEDGEPEKEMQMPEQKAQESEREAQMAGYLCAAVRKNGRKRYFSVMIFHQMHYFVYTYVILLTAVFLTGSMAKAVALYALTWVVYLIPQWAVERSGFSRPVAVFFVCHIGLAVMMGALAAAFWTGNVWLGLAAWMLTGLGGGSVFCIPCLVPEGVYEITASENIGHFLGTVLAAAVAALAGEKTGMVTAGLSCIFVLLAVVAAAVSRTKRAGMCREPAERKRQNR